MSEEKKRLKKRLTFFSFHSIKMEQETVYFGENSSIKNPFYKNKKPININEADIKRIKILKF